MRPESEQIAERVFGPCEPTLAPPEGAPAATRPALRWSPNRIAVIYLILAVLLLPWLVVLAFELPDQQLNRNYRLAWVGFDVMLAAVLLRTAWLAFRRSPYLVNITSAAATLLIVDAWFDVTTADSERERYMAIAAALLIELPLAIFSIGLARRAQRAIASSAGHLGRVP